VFQFSNTRSVPRGGTGFPTPHPRTLGSVLKCRGCSGYFKTEQFFNPVAAVRKCLRLFSLPRLVSRILLQVGPSRKPFACFEWPKNNIHDGEILRRHEQAGWRPRSPEDSRERDAAETWFAENDPERVAFKYDVSGVNRSVPATSTVYVAARLPASAVTPPARWP
jgi:hypothetical protein